MNRLLSEIDNLSTDVEVLEHLNIILDNGFYNFSKEDMHYLSTLSNILLEKILKVKEDVQKVNSAAYKIKNELKNR